MLITRSAHFYVLPALLAFLAATQLGCLPSPRDPKRAAMGHLRSDGADFGVASLEADRCYTDDDPNLVDVRFPADHAQVSVAIPNDLKAPEFVDIYFPDSHAKLTPKECRTFDILLNTKVDPLSSARTLTSGRVNLVCGVPGRGDHVVIDVALAECG